MKNLIRSAFDPGPHGACTSFGLILLRVAAGGMMLYAHGWGKLTGFSEMSGKFLDPLGIGSMPSLALAVFAEVFCAALVMIGLGTRVAAIPLLVTMIVAAFLVHGAEPFAKKELALLYGTAVLALVFTGAGKFSADSIFRKS